MYTTTLGSRAAGFTQTLDGNAPQRRGRYNVIFMLGLVYAAVAYVRSPVGIFVEELRRELHPAHTHADAHVTVLPPRPLRGSEQQALSALREVCKTVPAFEITMGDVESFVPITPTIFLRVARGAYRMRELHELLNRGALDYQEPWPYMPHLTIVKADTVDEAEKVEGIARQRWKAYADTRTVRIDSLTFVKGNGERWVDLAKVKLVGAPAP
jgi:2'-5' RNA ligase